MSNQKECRARATGIYQDGTAAASERCTFPNGKCALGRLSERFEYAGIVGGSTPCIRRFPDKWPMIRPSEN